MQVMIFLLAFGQCWVAAPRPAVAGIQFQATPVLIQPIESVDDAFQRGLDQGRAEGRAEMRWEYIRARKAARAASRCRLANCDCGCADGGPCACGPAGVTGQDLPTGVDGSKLDGPSRYTLNGRPITRTEAIRLTGQLVDDSAKPHLTVCGGLTPARRALRAAILKEAAVAASVRAQDYPADAPELKAFRIDGLTVYVQAPDGRVMLREPHADSLDQAALLDRIKEALGLKPKTPPPPPPKDAPKDPDGKPAPNPDRKSPAKRNGNGLIMLGSAAGILMLILLLARKDA